MMLGLTSTAVSADYTFKRLVLPDDGLLEYALALPDNFNAEREYPALLALPPGRQDQAMAVVSMEVVGVELRRRGWIVVSPIAPKGKLFYQGSERHLPLLLDRLVNTYRIKGRKFHFFGISNGGISAFRLGTLLPIAVASITVAPGYPTTADFRRLGALSGIPVSIIVGERDGRWVSNAIAAEKVLGRSGAKVSLEIVPDVGHSVYLTVGPEKLIEAIVRE